MFYGVLYFLMGFKVRLTRRFLHTMHGFVSRLLKGFTVAFNVKGFCLHFMGFIRAKSVCFTLPLEGRLLYSLRGLLFSMCIGLRRYYRM